MYSSSHGHLLRAGVRASAKGTQDPGMTLPTSLPTEGVGLFPPLGAGQGPGRGVCVFERVWVCTHM